LSTNMSEWDEFGFKEETHDDNKAVIDLINKILKRWYWLTLGACIGLAVSFIYLRYSTPIYQINAKVLVNDEKKGAGVDNALLGDLSGMLGAKSTVDNEIEILKTRTLMEEVVKELHSNIVYYRKGSIRDVELYESPFRVNIIKSDTAFNFHSFQLKPINDKQIQISNNDIKEIIGYNQVIDVPDFGSIKITRDSLIPYLDETYL